MVCFEVRNSTEADLGKYRCHASNIYGSDNSIAQLNLESKNMIDAIFSLFNKLCFAIKSITNSVNSVDSLGTISMEFQLNIVTYLVTSAILLLFCLIVFFCSTLLNNDSSFSCEDSRLENIGEYVFKCFKD